MRNWDAKLAEIQRERIGPRKMAEAYEEGIAKLEAERETATTKAQRSAINKQLHMKRGMLAWCRTRAGY